MKLFTTSQVADLLLLTPGRIRQMARANILTPLVKEGRTRLYTSAEIRKYLSGRRSKTAKTPEK